MPSEMPEPDKDRAIRWLTASPTVFQGMRQILDERDQLRGALEVSQRECKRHREQGDALREQVRQLHAELGRLQKERADAAHWVTTMLQEAAARFPLTPPPA